MYIVFDFINNDFDLVDTEKEAKEKAEDALEYYRGEASTDGWPDNIEKSIGYAKIIVQSKITKTISQKDYEEDEWPYGNFDDICFVDLVKKEE